jgi:hypothetical protein
MPGPAALASGGAGGAASSSSWAVDFVEYPAPLPSEVANPAVGSWAYFERVHGGGGAGGGGGGSGAAAPPPPRRVGVAFAVHDIKSINEVDGTVHVDFSVVLCWRDPVIAASAGAPGGVDAARDLSAAWSPGVIVSNAATVAADGAPAFRVRPGGVVECRTRYRGEITNRMDLRCFPFDADLLVLSLAAVGAPASAAVLVADPMAPAADTPVRHTLAEWELDPPPAVVTGLVGLRGAVIGGEDGGGAAAAAAAKKPVHSPADANSTCHLVLRVHRNPFFYIAKMVSVLEIVVLWSWSVFFYDVEDIAGRMSSSLTLFLSAVAFLTVINDRLPRMPYLTLMDKFTFVAFALLFLSAAETLIVYWAAHHLRDRATGEALDLVARLLFPVLHVASLGGMWWQVRRSRRTHLDLDAEL